MTGTDSPGDLDPSVAAERPPLRAGCIAIAAVVAVSRWLVAWPSSDDLLHSLADEVLLYPLAIDSVLPGTYRADSWLQLAEQVFAPAYSALCGPLIAALESPVRASWWISVVTGGVFILGAWRLLRALGRGPIAGTALVLLSAIPLFWTAAVGPGSALPRDVLHALLPWLLCAVWSEPARRPRVMLAIGLVLGVATNIHPLNGVHIGLLLGLLALCPPDDVGQRLRRAASLTTGFLVGAAPFVLRYMQYPRSGRPDAAVMDLRVPGMNLPPLAASVEAWAPALGIGIVALLLWRSTDGRRRLGIALVVCGFVGVVGERVGMVFPSLSQLQLGRFVRMSWLIGLVAMAGAVEVAVVSRRARHVVAVAMLVAVSLSAVVWTPWLRRGARALLGRAPPPAALSPDRPRSGELTGRSAADRLDYLALCRWTRDELPSDARVIVPPEDYSHFRLYARRSIVVSRKDGGFAATFLGARGTEWLREYRAVVSLYKTADTEGFATLAEASGATHLLAEREDPALRFPVAHETRRFVLYNLR